ncbi:MAG: NAD-dependent epimerase/dehydratase family protein [Pseudohongiellaceae bacterium]|nr:NAD-dependent epimerase/dehydratase family protein [Pseudohongiellaceae bacterium]
MKIDVHGKRVLLTGGTGFIGRTLLQRLQESRYDINVLSRKAPAQGPDTQGCRYFCGDITDSAILNDACAGVDTVFHLAAYAHVNQHDTALMRQTNIEGTRCLLEAALEQGVRRIVYFSSVLAAAEDSAISAYGLAKREAEQLLLDAAQKGQIEVVCLRPVNVYGLGMQGNLLSLIKLMMKGYFPPLPSPSARLSLVGSRDLCEAALLAALHDRANGQVYTVTDGRTYSLKGLETNIRRLKGKPAAKWAMPLPVFWLGAWTLELLGRVLRFANAPGLRSYRVLTQDNVFSCEKLQQELGYNPASNLGDELASIVRQFER